MSKCSMYYKSMKRCLSTNTIYQSLSIHSIVNSLLNRSPGLFLNFVANSQQLTNFLAIIKLYA